MLRIFWKICTRFGNVPSKFWNNLPKLGKNFEETVRNFKWMWKRLLGKVLKSGGYYK